MWAMGMEAPPRCSFSPGADNLEYWAQMPWTALEWDNGEIAILGRQVSKPKARTMVRKVFRLRFPATPLHWQPWGEEAEVLRAASYVFYVIAKDGLQDIDALVRAFEEKSPDRAPGGPKSGMGSL